MIWEENIKISNSQNIEDRVEILENVMKITFSNTTNLLEQLALEINNTKKLEEEVKSKMAENEVAEGILKKADANKDGKTTTVELFNFILKNPVFIFLAVVVISIMPVKDFILDGMETNIWDYSKLFETLISAIIGFVFYLLTKATDREYRTIIENLKTIFDKKTTTQSSDIEKLKNEITDLKDENTALKIKVNLYEYQLAHPETKITT